LCAIIIRLARMITASKCLGAPKNLLVGNY
jgi:hypothetical protein